MRPSRAFCLATEQVNKSVEQGSKIGRSANLIGRSGKADVLPARASFSGPMGRHQAPRPHVGRGGPSPKGLVGEGLPVVVTLRTGMALLGVCFTDSVPSVDDCSCSAHHPERVATSPESGTDLRRNQRSEQIGFTGPFLSGPAHPASRTSCTTSLEERNRTLRRSASGSRTAIWS